MAAERYLSAKEISVVLGVSRARAYEVLAQMPRVKFGANVRVSESAFAQWLKERELSPEPASPHEARRMRIQSRKRTRELKDAASEPFTIRLTRPRD